MLKDYIKQIRGVSYKPTDILDKNSNNAVPIVRANNIQERGLNFDDLVYIDKSKVKDEQYLQAGDIVICASSGSKDLVGKAAYCLENKRASFGAFCKVVRTSALHKKYLSHFFQSDRYRREISESSKGANINNIRNEDIDNLQIIVPSIEEQQRIADELDKVSGLIEKRQKQIEKLDLLIKSRFVEMFGGKQYNKKQINKLCNFIDYRGKTPDKSDKGIPLITAKNVKNNQFCIEPQEFIPEENYNIIMTRGIPMVNDILFTTEAPLGNVCRIPKLYDKFCVGQRIITMQPKKMILVSEYLEYALLGQEFQNELWKKSSGSTVKGVRSKLLGEIKIPVPPIELQNQFADFVEKVEQNKSKIKNRLDKLITLKKALMQKYFG